MKQPTIRTRIGTRQESLQYVTEIAALDYPSAKSDAEAISLPDGNDKAIRVLVNRDTGKPLRDKSGRLRICAPWLLSGIFG